MKFRQPALIPAAQAALLILALAATTACSGGSGSSTVGGGGGTGGGNGARFVWEDLNGDWVGQLAPAATAAPGVQGRNAYLRWSEQRLIEAAESGGQEFLDGNSTRTFKFSARGALTADLDVAATDGRLLLSGSMDASRSVLQGTYQLTDADGEQRNGTFTFTRSIGAGQFTQEMLTGRWDGLGKNGVGKFRFLKLELDAAGVVVDGLMRHPDTENKIRDYSPGAGVLNFSDSSVGRINNVLVVSDQGETLTAPFLLLDLDGTLLAGAGTESGLGQGIAELVRGL